MLNDFLFVFMLKNIGCVNNYEHMVVWLIQHMVV